MNQHPLRIYFAGDLFNCKDLGGNLMLRDAIQSISNRKYDILLPQDGECEVLQRTSQSIRDADFQLLFQCDAVIANFDGTDLDSGTVVEFCFAKMLDLPTVLLRTDFRDGGDRTLPDGAPWNLMCSHFPRTEILHLNGMVWYHEYKNRAKTAAELLAGYYKGIAEETIKAMDKVVHTPSWLSPNDVLEQYRKTIQSIGGSLPEKFPEEKLKNIVRSKILNGIYS